MPFVTIFEAPELEVARLAAAPVGSENHTLSTLPVQIQGPIDDLVIELPRETNHGHSIVVVPFLRQPDSSVERETMPYRRYRTWWSVIVVASNHPSYPVGGHRLAISESALVRGTLRSIEVPPAPVAEVEVAA